jgi:hypothetical protein
MIAEEKEKNVNVKIERIKEISFQCKEISTEIEKKISGKNLEFKAGVRLIPNKVEKEFGCAILIVYSYLANNDSEELCSYEIECVFKIEEYEKVIKINEGDISISDGLLSTFINITVGAIRGMMALKTTGTILNKYPLPILNSLEILKQLKQQIRK